MRRRLGVAHQLRIKAAATQEIRDLPQDIQQRIRKRIRELVDAPRPRGTKKLVGEEGVYRVRVGAYRIIYSINDSLQVIHILQVVKRGGAYQD
ncbi:type II toxin-antitoxin system RelE/ParE family toxin [Candidatus Poribacteria bacterium]|nr:type II toxin-antitoxin system RelE/ParE family toxin [Candidatus Poribacteria bacterium]